MGVKDDSSVVSGAGEVSTRPESDADPSPNPTNVGTLEIAGAGFACIMNCTSWKARNS